MSAGLEAGGGGRHTQVGHSNQRTITAMKVMVAVVEVVVVNAIRARQEDHRIHHHHHPDPLTTTSTPEESRLERGGREE